ncbi:uncharacterized protein LOC143920597 [Arctopsyche grandis]|uniref:uncharacterized protein LOC143920597 n=1 Tax=Arctopsyche grandis TaxID=121162 RepID=UPI00406DA341
MSGREGRPLLPALLPSPGPLLFLLLLPLLLPAGPARARANPKRFGDRLEPRLPPRQHQPSTTQPTPPEPDPTTPSHTEAHRLEMSTDYFVVPEKMIPQPPPAQPSSTEIYIEDAIVETETSPTIVNTTTIPQTPTAGLRKEPWALPLLILSSLVMLSVASFEAFVLCKVWRTAPGRRHLFLGQMLLLGLFACAAQGALMTATPTVAACAAVRFGAGLSLALVFASLLVKCVFLASLEGGVYLPAPYQALLLFFAVLTQAVIGAQWLGASPPRALPATPPLPERCRAPFVDLLLSLSYAACLAAAAAALAVRARGREREASHIAWACGGGALLAGAGAGAALLASPRHRDGCLGFGLALASAAIFIVMFAPKGRQLAAFGREARADREERLSSLSRAASAYSPSFFHFKPVKYGVVGPAPAASPPTTTPAGANTWKRPAPPSPPDRYPAALARLYCYPGMPPLHPYAPPCHFYCPPPRFAPGLLMRSDDVNMYTTLEPTFSSNPNVYFQRNDGVHPGMMY